MKKESKANTEESRFDISDEVLDQLLKDYRKPEDLLGSDFAFGGNDYVLKSTDVQNQVGLHDILFAFEFGGRRYYFLCNTIEHTKVWQCDENYRPLKEMTRDEFCAFLFEMYRIELPHTTFRDIVGRYFRIYGRDNLDEHKPLGTTRGEVPKKAITALMKLLAAYAAIHDLQVAFEKSKNERDAYKKAQDFQFIPSVVKRQLQDNEKRIEELQAELAQLQANSGNELMGLETDQADRIADLRKRLTTAKRQKSRLLSQLSAIESDIGYEKQFPESLFDVATSPDNLRARAFQRLQSFFPEVSLRKISDMEAFHKQFVGVLNEEYEEAQQRHRAYSRNCVTG